MNEKPPNPIEYWGGKPKNLLSVIGEKSPKLQVKYCKEESRKESSKKKV